MIVLFSTTSQQGKTVCLGSVIFLYSVCNRKKRPQSVSMQTDELWFKYNENTNEMLQNMFKERVHLYIERGSSQGTDHKGSLETHVKYVN